MNLMMAFQNIVLGSMNRKENKGLPDELEKLFIISQILKFRKSCEMTERTSLKKHGDEDEEKLRDSESDDKTSD